MLGDAQYACLVDFAKLVLKAVSLGIDFRPGEGVRTQLQAWANSLPPKTTITGGTEDNKEFHFWETVGGVGKSQSLHLSKLAYDLSIIKNGKISQDIEDYRALGDYWKSLDPKNRWGGEFTTRSDPFHFERNESS